MDISFNLGINFVLGVNRTLISKIELIIIIEPEFCYDFRQTFKSNYEALKEQLTALPDKLSHDVMVSSVQVKYEALKEQLRTCLINCHMMLW